MAEPTFLQKVVSEAVDLFDFVGKWLNEKSVRAALIRDLGGNPNAAAGAEFPTAPMEAIKAYRDAANTDAAADAAVVADVLQILDFLTSQIEVWAAERDVIAGVDQFVQSAIDLAATNYVRLRWPRLFLIMQAVTTLQEMTTTYGAGSNSGVRLYSSLKTVVEFLFNPGRALEQLQPNADPDLPSVFDNYGINHRTIDGLFRLGATMLGWMHVNEKWKDITGDVLAGWDAPGLDIDSTAPPRAADIVSNQMVSFSFYPEDAEFEGDAETAKPLLLSLAYAPALLPAQGVFVAFGGHLEKDISVGDRWTFTAKIRSDAGVAVLLGVPPRTAGPFDEANFAASVGFASRPDALTQLSFSIPKPIGSRLDIGQLSAAASLGSDGAEVKASMTDAALVLDGEDNDSFIRKLLGGKPMRLPFNVTIGYASGRGLILEGGVPSTSPPSQTPGGQPSPPPGTAQRTALAGDGPVGGNTIDATIPIGRRIGPVTVLEVALRLTRTATVPEGETDVYAVELATSFSVTTGPVFFRLDRLGLGFVLDTGKPPAERNLRLFDASLSISPPLGIAVQVDTELVSGGGTIFHDPASGTYFGVLALRLGKSFTLKAFGLVATKNADGTPGSSFIIIGTLEGLGWQIGPVTVDGLGLLFASDRTFDENAVRAALPTGQLKYLLFPADPVHNTTEIMRPLATFFPALPGSTLVGILVKLTFGRTQLVRLDLAFILQFGNAVSTRLIVLGRLSSVVPTEQVRAVQLNLDAVGVFDFSAGIAALDAVLVDSKLCGRFPLTGAAAFRRTPGVSGFALAVGGFHPRFAAPPGFPALPRITVALTDGDNPKLVCQAYVAITANTVQLGASATLYAAACGFSIEGNIGFDVLIQLWPPHFLAEFRASVQLKRGSTNLFKVSVEAALEGPFPLRVAGKATFEILWWDYSIGFDKTLIKGDDIVPPTVAPVDAQAEVIAALADPRSWRVDAPAAADRIVVVRRDDRTDQILLHPMGTLQVQQGIAPLNLGRDIDRLGEARPSGARRFAITSVRLGGVNQTTRPVREQFAPGQLFDLTDDERLAAPSFEEMDAGVAFGDDTYAFAASAVERSPFDYTEITIGPDGTPTVEPEPVPTEGPLVLVLAGLGAAARASFREPSTRFRSRPSPGAPVMRPLGYAVASADGAGAPATPGPTTTWAEAHHALNVGSVGPRAVLVLANAEDASS
jgi:hypothetical protein